MPIATKVAHDLNQIPGGVDSHVFQVPDAPALTVDVDRTVAREVGLGQKTVADNLLVSLNNSAQVAPNFWLNPRNDVSYPLVVQTPTYRIRIDPGPVDLAGDGVADRHPAGADERRHVRPQQGADGDVAI